MVTVRVLWGSGSIPCTRHGHLKQDDAIAHVSICSVYFLVTKFTISISVDYVTIMATVLVKAIKTSIPDGWVHAFDVLFDRAISGNPLLAESTVRVKFFCPSM